MPQLSQSLRVLLPLVASGLLSFAVCALMAVFLFHEQATSAAALQENIQSHRASADLEENIADLVALLRDRVEGVSAVNDRIVEHIDLVLKLADHPEESLLANRVNDSFQRYLTYWREIADKPGTAHDEEIRIALQIVDGETHKACHELREHNARRIDEANQEHRATLRQLAWGLAAIGGSAGLAGLFIGLGISRGLRKSIQQIQVRVQDAAGKLGHDLPAVDVTGVNFEHLDLQVQGLVTRIEDVVERLNQREREIRRAEQLAAVGQLAAGMAHEIRNPLTSIKMLVQAAAEDKLGALPPDDLAVIDREIRRVERSLQTFLDFARPPRPSKASVDLRTVVRETIELTRGRVAKQRVEVRFAPPINAIVVDADAAQLRQVLVNLVLNALDAMPGGGTLSIELDTNGSMVEARISDTGPGIAPEIAKRLFQPFASTRDTGLGLGLVISRRIIEDHGGTISSENLSPGARFTIRLPRIGNG